MHWCTEWWCICKIIVQSGTKMCQIFVNSNQVDVGFLWNSQRIYRDLTMGGEGCRRCTGALNDDAFAARPRSLLGPICLLSSLSDARASLWNVLENILEQSLSERLSSNFLAQIEGLAMFGAALGTGKRQAGGYSELGRDPPYFLYFYLYLHLLFNLYLHL